MVKVPATVKWWSVLVAVIVTISASLWGTRSNSDLTERPPYSPAPPPTLATESSTVSVGVDLPRDEVLAMVKAQLPSSIKVTGAWQQYIRGRRQSGTFDLDVNGIVWTLTDAGKDLRIGMSVNASGDAKVESRFARAVGRRNFRADFDAGAKVSLEMDWQWCPRLVITPELVKWRDKQHPQLEVLPRVWATKVARSAFEAQVSTAMTAIVHQLNNEIPCPSLQAKLKELWKTHSIAIPGLVAAPRVFEAYITPMEASFDMPVLTYRGLHASIIVKAITSVSGSTPSVPGPLPKLQTQPIEKGRALLNLPLTIPYPVLTAMVASQIQKDMSFMIFDTTAAARLRDLEIYPSNGKLAVGVNITASIPGKLFNATGRVWLVAEPEVDAVNQTFALKSMSIAPKLDNQVWQALSGAFDDRLVREVTRAAQIDLKPKVAELKERVTKPLEGVNAGQSGVKVEVGNIDVQLLQVTPAQELYMVGRTSADLGVRLDLAKLMATPSAANTARGTAPTTATTKPSR